MYLYMYRSDWPANMSWFVTNSGMWTSIHDESFCAAYLNGVQFWLQQKISAEIEAISGSATSSDESIPVTGSDDVSLYRIGGWAILSVIKDRKKKIEKC